MDRKAIVFKCANNGLANRLRAYLGYVALSRVLRVPFYLYWFPTPQCDGEITSIFDIPREYLIEAIPAEEVARGRILVVEETLWFDRIWQRHASAHVPWRHFAREVRRVIDEFQPAARVREIVESFSARYDLERHIGMHIRHSDNVEFYPRWRTSTGGNFCARKTSRLSGFLRTIEASESESRYFLATDNQLLRDALVHCYNDRIFTYPAAYREPSKTSKRSTDLMTAAIEMLLLSRCRRVIGTYYSSYSKMSCIIGGGEYYEIRRDRPVRHFSLAVTQVALGNQKYQLPWWALLGSFRSPL